MERYALDFLNNCLRTGALGFDKSDLTSGRSSGYFFNLALAIKDGMGLAATKKAFLEQLEVFWGNMLADWIEEYRDERFLFGPAYKGIPLSSLVTEGLYDKYGINMRWGHNRKEKKDHGPDKGLFVGDLRDGDIVTILDDVMTTGLTKKETWKDLTKTYKNLVHGGIVLAFDRNEVDSNGNPPIQKFNEEGIEVSSILYAPDVFEYLHKNNLVSEMNYKIFMAHQEEFGVRN